MQNTKLVIIWAIIHSSGGSALSSGGSTFLASMFGLFSAPGISLEMLVYFI